MKKIQRFLLVVILLTFVTKTFAQRGNYRITNGFSISGGYSQFDIVTNNFETKAGNGFAAGFLATVDIPNQWYNIGFGLQFAENTLGISGRQDLISANHTFIDYKLMKVQAVLLANIKVVENIFTIDVGPMIQYNSSLELKDDTEKNYYITNYNTLMADDITDISKFNFNGVVGASVGIKNIKLRGQYIYGFTNILKNLENKNLDTSGGNARFKGNQSMMVFGATISF
ncbi:hypothetical protein FUA26_03985 [Seonamhaeicola algicola]|uniref:PorT family protein n=1 Tax=Seonamhaeicola algicola TaxID=1719036 RepID=A0A5C7B530_9FLAO|nr:hypothetical protein [Seonamhaeicola algicola]TXE12962.1 hypothetical protein FUA26_03985 [Seonamhaeicola algicola]